MKTLADIRRRAVAGARLEVITQTRRPALAGTIRTITRSAGCRPSRCYDWVSDIEGDEGYYCTPWPKASHVRIIDPDTFEYDLPHPNKGHVIRLRFLP